MQQRLRPPLHVQLCLDRDLPATGTRRSDRHRTSIGKRYILPWPCRNLGFSGLQRASGSRIFELKLDVSPLRLYCRIHSKLANEGGKTSLPPRSIGPLPLLGPWTFSAMPDSFGHFRKAASAPA